MFIRYIFGETEDPPEDGKGLWSVIFPDEAGNVDREFIDILRDTFDKWLDTEYMYNFCKEHIEDIRNKLGKDITVSRAANYLIEEAERLDQELYEASTTHTVANNLQSIFKPLNDNEPDLYELQCSKTRVRHSKMKGVSPILRLYAIRIDPNTYIITGGAIKLTDKMIERPHTQKEKAKILKVQDWLNHHNIAYPEDLNQLI